MGIYWIMLAIFYVTVLIHSGNSCTLQIEKDRDFVLLGQRAHLNCTSNCPGVSWETRLAKPSSGVKTDYFTSTEVLINDYDDSPITCLLIADDSLYNAEVRVEAYALPSKVDIDLKEQLEEDKEHQVKCSVDNVAPVKNVILSVTRRGEPFLIRTYEEDTRRGPQNLSEKFNFTARRSDNRQDFACLVTLNLTRVANTTVQSSPVNIKTYALPENPRITAEKWMEQGTVTNISCEVHHVFPSENITTQLFVEGFPNTMSNGNVFVLFTLDTSGLLPAQYNVVCESQVLNFSRQSNMHIHIYESPNVSLTVSRKVLHLGDTVTIHCSLIRGNGMYFGLSLLVDGAVVKKLSSRNLDKNITVTRRKPNLSVICEIFICENDKVLLKSEKDLNVHYPPGTPTMNISSTSPNPGDPVSFTCHADSQPPPTFSWEIPPNVQVEESRDNRSIAIREVLYQHSGKYTCHVTNEHGQSFAQRSLEVQKGNTVLLPVLVCVGLIILAAVIIGWFYISRQNRIRGFYDLANPNSEEIPMTESAD